MPRLNMEGIVYVKTLINRSDHCIHITAPKDTEVDSYELLDRMEVHMLMLLMMNNRVSSHSSLLGVTAAAL